MSPLDACCDASEKRCFCECDICPPSHVAVKDDDEDESLDKEVTRNALSEQRLNQKLESLPYSLSDTASCEHIFSEEVLFFLKGILKEIVSKYHGFIYCSIHCAKKSILYVYNAQEICKDSTLCILR